MSQEQETPMAPAAPAQNRVWELNTKVPDDQLLHVWYTCMNGFAQLRLGGEHLNLLLCAQPKSASLYAAELLARSLGLANVPVGFDRRSGGLYYPRLVATKYLERSTISQCHAAPDRPVRTMIELLGYRPIVLTRDLLDALVSRRDMLVRDKTAGALLSPDGMAHFLCATPSEQLDWVIDLFAAESINFSAGWSFYRDDEDLRPLFLTYEELVSDEVGSVLRLAEALELDVRPDDVAHHVDEIRAAGGINHNVGIAGRGQAEMSEAQIERLRTLALRLGCEDEAFLGFGL